MTTEVDPDVEKLESRFKQNKGNRTRWESFWQDIYQIFVPRRATVTAASIEGERRDDELYDSVPARAHRDLKATIDGLLKPKSTRWLKQKPADDALEDDEEVKAWLDDAHERHWNAMYDRRAKFVRRSGEVDGDLVAIGWGVLFRGIRRDQRGFIFRAFHPKDALYLENADGNIDTIFITQHFTPRQAIQEFGEKNLSADVLKLGKDERKRDERLEFRWVVLPREERRQGSLLPQDMPFASIKYEVATGHKISELGFRRFPFTIPRWDTSSGELYPRSPAMIALCDAETLQQQGKTILVAGHKIVEPPLAIANDAVLATPRTWPGGLTPFDAEAVRGLGGVRPVFPIETGGNIPIGREMQNDTRLQIERAFFQDILQATADRPNVTATEILERREIFFRVLGPTLGQLEDDYTADAAEGSFDDMLDLGALPPMPEVLKEAGGIKFEYASPVAQARKQLEAAALSRSFEFLAPIASVQPEVMDNFNGNEIARDTPEVMGFPRKWLRSQDEVDQKRQRDAEAAQAAQQAELIERGADVAQKVVPLIDDGEAA